MLDLLAFILAAVAVIVALQFLADRTGLPAAALFTVAGLVYAVLPGPNLRLDPHVILTFVIPPLIYSAALNSSLLAIRANLRTVISLSIGLVLATALVTGAGMALFVPGVGLAAGVALGAAISPTDPVAALAVGGRAGLPAKLITIIEGEGLLNDATALTTLTVAVTAATSGGFSLGDAIGRFGLAAAGGLLSGVVVAMAVRLMLPAVRDPLLVNGISLGTPFAAYLLGEELHVSGVLAVAVAGLMIGHNTPRFTSGASRLQATAVWHLADFLLQGFVFLLIGQQIVPVVRGLRAYPATTIWAAAAVSLGVVLLLRPLWLALTQTVPRALRARRVHRGHRSPAKGDGSYLSGREVAVLSWAGTRGVISLAAVFTIPLATADGRPFPGRDLLLFCAFGVVVVTLIGQGLTFGPVARVLGVRANLVDAALVRTQARAAAVQAGLSRLDQLAAGDAVPDAAVAAPYLAALRTSLEQKARRYRQLLGRLEAGEERGAGRHAGVPGRRAGPAVRHRRAARGTAPLARRRPPARRQPAHAGTRTRPRGTDAPRTRATDGPDRQSARYRDRDRGTLLGHGEAAGGLRGSRGGPAPGTPRGTWPWPSRGRPRWRARTWWPGWRDWTPSTTTCGRRCAGPWTRTTEPRVTAGRAPAGRGARTLLGSPRSPQRRAPVVRRGTDAVRGCGGGYGPRSDELPGRGRSAGDRPSRLRRGGAGKRRGGGAGPRARRAGRAGRRPHHRGAAGPGAESVCRRRRSSPPRSGVARPGRGTAARTTRPGRPGRSGPDDVTAPDVSAG